MQITRADVSTVFLSGPDLTNQIAGVLLRFREEQVAVMGDTETIFHHVKIPDDQCSFLRFLWWDDCDTNKEIIDYKMTAHVCGGALSPSCSNFALRKTASNNRDEYPSDVIRILERIFCVDDMLKSFQTVTEAKDVIRKVKELCTKGGFKVRLPPFKKIFVICLIESPSKMMKNAFYFILKALFFLKIFTFLSQLFGHVGKTA